MQFNRRAAAGGEALDAMAKDGVVCLGTAVCVGNAARLLLNDPRPRLPTLHRLPLGPVPSNVTRLHRPTVDINRARLPKEPVGLGWAGWAGWDMQSPSLHSLVDYPTAN